MEKTIRRPEGERSLCEEKSLKEERAEIVEKGLIAAAELTVGAIRTGAQWNTKISNRIEAQK